MQDTFDIREVFFDPEEHSYTARGKVLSGITPIVAEILHKYYGSGALQAMEHGSAVHEAVHKSLTAGRFPVNPEARYIVETLLSRYENLRSRVHSEWLVSDGMFVASAIDAAVSVDSSGCSGMYDLYDYKTGHYDFDYCRWQLGFYRYMLEASRGFSVRKCWVIASKDRIVYPVMPVPSEMVRVQIERYIHG